MVEVCGRRRRCFSHCAAGDRGKATTVRGLRCDYIVRTAASSYYHPILAPCTSVRGEEVQDLTQGRPRKLIVGSIHEVCVSDATVPRSKPSTVLQYAGQEAAERPRNRRHDSLSAPTPEAAGRTSIANRSCGGVGRGCLGGVLEGWAVGAVGAGLDVLAGPRNVQLNGNIYICNTAVLAIISEARASILRKLLQRWIQC